MWVVLSGVIVLLLVINLTFAMHLKRAKREINKLHIMIEVVENVKDIVYYCDVPKLHYQYLSPVINTLLGPGELEEHLSNPDKIFDLVHPDDYETLMKKKLGQLDYNKPIHVRLKNRVGEYIWFEEYATPIYKNGELVAVEGIYRNISEKIALQQQLEYKATHDALTNLYNRTYFETKFNDLNETTDVPVTLAIFDLDNLKYVNDQHGHKAGDDFIKRAATIFQQAVKDSEFVARIGGDEFVLLLTDTTDARLHELFANIQQAVETENRLNPAYPVEFSKGYASAHSSLHQMEHLYMEADLHMYEEKQTKIRYRTHLEMMI